MLARHPSMEVFDAGITAGNDRRFIAVDTYSCLVRLAGNTMAVRLHTPLVRIPSPRL
jgi:hypothetical protein